MGKKYGKIILPAVAAIAAGVGAVHTYGDYNRTDNTLMLLNAEGLSAMADPGEPGDGNSDKDDSYVTIYKLTGEKCYPLKGTDLTVQYNKCRYDTEIDTEFGRKKCKQFDLQYDLGIPIQESKSVRKSRSSDYISSGWSYSSCATAIFASKCQYEHGKYAIIKDCAPGTVEQHSLLVCPGYREGYPRP